MIKCTFEDSLPAERGLRHVTVDGIIIKDNKILLGKRGLYNGKPMNEFGKWGMIGGFLDRDETIAEGLIREAREEVGCEITNLRLLQIIDNPERPKEDRQNITFVIVADFVSQRNEISEEVKEFKWFDIDNLPPAEELAFDHSESIYLLRDYLKKKIDPASIQRFPGAILT